MKFEELLTAVGDEPVFETGFLLVGDVEPSDVRRQFSRWVELGRLLQLRRGLYTLAPPYRKSHPHPFLVANRMVRGSYVSLQSALSYHGLIPEGVPVTTSVTTSRPGRWDTPLGVYDFRHVQPAFFQGYRRTEVAKDQEAFVATPEKALLDLIYLEPSSDDPAYLSELRLQHLDRIDPEALLWQAEAFHRPKLLRAARWIAHQAESEASEYEPLWETISRTVCGRVDGFSPAGLSGDKASRPPTQKPRHAALRARGDFRATQGRICRRREGGGALR